MSEYLPKLLGLPAPSKVRVETGVSKPNQTSGIDKRPVVYGKDLNSSDFLLIAVNRSLKEIMTEEYDLGSDFSWEFPSVFSTTSRKVIVDDEEHEYFINFFYLF